MPAGGLDMRTIALTILATLPAASSSSQFNIEHISEATVVYQDVASGIQNDFVEIKDTIHTTVPFGTLLNERSHEVSYHHPNLGYDPTASSKFSVDDVQVLDHDINGYFVRYTLSGEVHRRGPGITAVSDAVLFAEARATQTIRIHLEPVGGAFGIFFADASGVFSTDYTIPGNTSVFTVDAILNDGSRVTIQDHVPAFEPVSAVDLMNINSPNGTDYIELSISSNHFQGLAAIGGDNTFQYQLEFYTIVQNIPAPSSAMLAITASLAAARRRR